jgi:hypothetical protein
MLPVAMSRFPWIAAVVMIAISGRLVAIASRIAPPIASPRPKRFERTSVAFESLMPASQTNAEATTKPTIRSATVS